MARMEIKETQFFWSVKTKKKKKKISCVVKKLSERFVRRNFLRIREKWLKAAERNPALKIWSSIRV